MSVPRTEVPAVRKVAIVTGSATGVGAATVTGELLLLDGGMHLGAGARR